MEKVIVSKTDEIIMKLMHYFVTEENYTPIIVNGVKDEIWLENTENYYKIIRINANYIHNIEQYNYDLYKVKKIVAQVKKKTLSFKMRTLNILLDVNDDVEIQDTKNITSLKIKNVKDIKTSQKLLESFPDIKNNPLNNEKGFDLLINVTKEINEKTEEKNRNYEDVFKQKKILITYILMGINIGMFFLTYLIYFITKGNVDLYNLLSVNASAVKSGEIYRLLTGTFMHAGPLYLPIHLFFNMYALYIIGTQVENFIGRYRYLIIYLGSAIMGSLLSCVILHGDSIGASGAIFGLMGSLVYFGYHYRVYFGNILKTQIIPLIIFNLFLGFYLSGVDNFAHIGGLIGGVLLTMAVGLKHKSQKSEQINGAIVYILLLGFLLFMLFYR
ncbi:MAG TPA: rhomboid family intramembrane serine protease [Bacilli bacterium]|nr:rhomboid family intramembrane serine protease [Bacilli bacterium]